MKYLPQNHQPSSSILPYRWRLLVVLWGCFFLHQGDRQIFNSLIPLLRADLNLTNVQIGLVTSVFTVVYGVIVPFGGFLGDTFQKRTIIGLSLLTFSSGTLLTGLAGSVVALVLCRSLATGAGEAIYYPSASALISQHHVRTRSLGLAVHQSALYVGIVASGWLAGLIGEHFGWRTAFVGFGAAGLLWSIAVAFSLKSERSSKASNIVADQPAESRPHLLQALRYILRKPTFYLLCVAFGGQVFVNVGYTTWMATYLHETFHLSLAGAGFHSMFWHFLAAAVGVFLGAHVADRWEARRPAIRLEVQCVGLMLGTPFIALLAFTTSLPLLFAALAGFGFFRGLYDSNLFACLFDVIEPRYRSSAAGLMLSAAFIAGAPAPTVLGWLKSSSGLQPGLTLLAATFFLSGLALLCARQFSFERDRIRENSPNPITV